MAPGPARQPAIGQERVRYDGDQRLLAFAGAVSLLVGTLFWALAGLRFAAVAAGPGTAPFEAPAAAACFAVAIAGLLLTLVAWGLSSKMQHGIPIQRNEISRLLIGGFIVGVILGFLIYAALRYKLEDPDFYHLASKPDHTPPAMR